MGVDPMKNFDIDLGSKKFHHPELELLMENFEVRWVPAYYPLPTN